MAKVVTKMAAYWLPFYYAASMDANRKPNKSQKIEGGENATIKVPYRRSPIFDETVQPQDVFMQPVR